MRLPAGLWLQGRLQRDFRFKSLTGKAEMALAECASEGSSMPARVTSALVGTLASVGGQQPSHALVQRLFVTDRQFLMRQLAIQLGLNNVWLTPQCPQCGVAFDVLVTLSALPIKPAGQGFPYAPVRTSQGTFHVRAPNGDDQESIVDLDDPATALRCIISRCIVEQLKDNEHHRSTDDPAVDVSALSEEDLSAIETALESICPELTICVRAVCPECRAAQDVPVDPYLCLRRSHSEIYTDVHVLASVYHWSEPQILALSRSRRKRYLSMVDRERGMAY
jgi:hypothetical protein